MHFVVIFLLLALHGSFSPLAGLICLEVLVLLHFADQSLVATPLGLFFSSLLGLLGLTVLSVLFDQFEDLVFGQWAAVKLLERGIICQPASQSWERLKLEPPLTINASQIQWLIEQVGEVLDEYQGIAPLLEEVSGRLGQQFLVQWAF